MNHVPAHRLTFSSPAAQRIREAERRAVERMAEEATSAGASIIPPPSDGPLYEGVPDLAAVLPPPFPEWWIPERPQPRFPSISHIQRVVCAAFEVRMVELLSNRRFKAFVLPRQVAMYLCKVMTPRSLPEIGRRFGGRDHTTVLHAVRKIEGMMKSDTDFARQVQEIRTMFVEAE